MSTPRLILLFVKWPEPGRVKTRLGRDLGDAQAVEIYRELVAGVINALPVSEFDGLRICFDPPERRQEVEAWLHPLVETVKIRVIFEPQVPGDLGDRLAGAFASAFADSEGNRARVLAIGSDCLEITPEDYDQAFAALDQDEIDVVFGPSFDGGYYLVGIDAPQPSLFREIPWSAEDTLDVSLAAATSAGLRVAFLDQHHDIDTASDWHRFCGKEEPI